MAVPDRSAIAGQLGIELGADQWAALTRYVELLQRWNARFNLISRKDAGRIWSRHVFDSLSILPLLLTLPRSGQQCRAVDVGSGAGLPGLPLAIADAKTEWRLVDRNTRKVRFLELAVQELDLPNVTATALDLGASPPRDLAGWADVVVSRAVAAPSVLVERTSTLLAPEGTFVLMTGAAERATEPRSVGAVVSERQPEFRVSAVHELQIPGLDRPHEVTIIRRDGNGRTG